MTCNQVAMFLQKYLKQVGIDSEIEGNRIYENFGHVYLVAKLKNVLIKNKLIKEMEIVLDTYKDLMKSKKGARLKGYGIDSEQAKSSMYQSKYHISEIPQEMKERAEHYDIERGYIFVGKSIDEKGNTIKKAIYLDDVIEQLREEICKEENILIYADEHESKNNKERTKDDIAKYCVHFLTKYLKNNDGIDVTGSEWERYFNAIAYSISEGQRIEFSQMRLGNIKDKEKVENYMRVKYKNGDIEHYMYDKEHKGYVLRDREYVKKYTKDKNIYSLQDNNIDFFEE